MGRPRMRRLLVVVAVLIGLPLLALAVAGALIPKDKLAAEIADQVAQYTGAEVTPGEASLNVAGGLGLRLTGGRLQGSGAELARRTGAGRDVGLYDLEYSELKVSLGLLSLLRQQVEVKAVRLAGPGVVLDLSGDEIRLRDYEILITDLRVDLAAGPLPKSEAPGQNIPVDLRFKIEARAAELVQKNIPWQEIRAKGVWAARQLEIASMTGRLAGGNIKVSGTLDYAKDPWGALAWTAHFEDLPAGQVLPPYLPDLGEKLACDLTGEVTGTMALRDKATRLQSLDLTGQLSSGEGVLHAAAWLQDVSQYLGQRQDLKTVRFSRLSHQFAVAEGRYLVDQLEIDGLDTDWQASGWLGFAGDIGLKVGVRLPAGFTPDLGGMSFLAETMRDAEGRVHLGLNLSGQIAKPSIGLDLSGLGRLQ